MGQKIGAMLLAMGLAVLLLASVACGDGANGNDGSATASPKPGVTAKATAAPDTQRQKAPDFSVADSDGNSVKLSDILKNGKPVVLNFWASWCPPCRGEMPEFEQVFKERGSEVQFMMVNLTDGQRETKEIAMQYVSAQGFTFPVYFDLNQEGSAAYISRYIPATYFIDKDGYIVSSREGQIDKAFLLNGIAAMQ